MQDTTPNLLPEKIYVYCYTCPGIKDNNTFFWLSQGIYSYLSSGTCDQTNEAIIKIPNYQ